MYEPPVRSGATQANPSSAAQGGVNLLIRLNIKYIIKLLVLWMIPITIISLITGVSSYLLISRYKAKVYMARTLLLRYEKGVARTSDVPYLYPEINLNTLLETVKLPQNLSEVIDKLGLDNTEKDLFDMIQVHPGNRSNTIHIFVYHNDPLMAATIANTISEVYIDAYSRIFNSAAQKMYEYYLSQRVLVRREVSEAESEMLRYREEMGLYMADEELKLKLKQLSDTELKLEDVRLKKRELISKVEDIKTRIEGMPDTVKISETMTSQREKELLFLEREMELMKQRYTDSHPEMIELRLKIQQVRSELASDSLTDVRNLPDSETFAQNAIKQSMIIELNRMENELHAFDDQIAAYDEIMLNIREELRSLSSVQETYFNLRQKVESSRQLLDMVDNRISEARIARDANTHDLAILERAVPPVFPESTGRRLMGIVSTFGMAFICLLFVMSYAIFSPGVKVPSDLDSMPAVDIIGVLPRKKNSTLGTYFSTLQVVVNKIDQHVTKGKPTLISVSSLKHKEGKSTLIDDITDMKSSTGKKMLIIKRIRESEYNRNIQVPANAVVNLASIRDDVIERPKPVEISGNISRLYYIVDRNISKLNISAETIDNLIANYNEYDYIFFELFSPKRNLQVSSCIMRAADYNILITLYGKNGFSNIDKITRSAMEGSKRKVGTVINCGDLSLV